MSFISELFKRRSLYANPEQATTQAKSLNLLSAGIYTEEERFVFELLQNAVDAFDDEHDILRIKISCINNHLVFQHNGEAFNKRDVEGLCDVGNGNKLSDKEKIGYKGIGFKSVFVHAKKVTIYSGEFCFSFDKSSWDNYWDSNWGEKVGEQKVLMPWQIIPIESNIPFDIDCEGYNVSTFIPTTTIGILKNKVQNLLSDCQFLLFLRANNIDIRFVVDRCEVLSVRKQKVEDIVTLFVNEHENSRWLVHSENIAVDKSNSFQVKLQDDINTPDKLKESSTFDLTFAIPINGNSIQPLKESKIYTYLPTSETMDFPFLVNANFITDAGRQQLHKDAVWNHMIFSRIPHSFLNWISTISREYPNYYDILPKRKGYGNDNLAAIFCQELDSAIKTIAFIPSLTDGVLLKSSEAIIDKVSVGEVVTEEKLVAHINRQRNANYTIESLIANRGTRILTSYGVYDFGVKELSVLLEDKSIFAELTVKENADIIFYLFELYNSYINIEDKNALIEKLSSTAFLLADDNSVMAPTSLYLPSKYYEDNALASDERLLNADLYAMIYERTGIIQWLENLGVQELSDISFIRQRICSGYFITKDNAIEVVKFLFEKRDILFKKISDYDMSKLKFMTKKGALKFASELYFSHEYKPQLDIENLCDEDVFISDEYIGSYNMPELKIFFSRLGVNDNIALTKINKEELIKEKYSFLSEAWEIAKEKKNVASSGTYINHPHRFSIEYYPILNPECCNVQLLSTLWSHILSSQYIEEDKSSIPGRYGWTECGDNNLNIKSLIGISTRKKLIQDYQLFPSTIGQVALSRNLYLNSESNIKFASRFLPIINVDCVIDDSWLDILNLKRELGLTEYLEILTKISLDTQNIEQNKDCIKEIFKLIIDRGYIHSYQEEIIKWAETNKILSRDNKFVCPKKLSYITIDGFSSAGRIYIGDLPVRSNDDYLKFFELLGVRVITERNISPVFSATRRNDELRKKIQEKLSVFALLKAGEKPTQEEYDKCLRDIGILINQTTFYQCDNISLSYGDESDCIEKKTFTSGGSFYYVGDLRPANIVPLLTPLCKYLGLRNLEQDLSIVFFENIDGIRMYLKDKEYNVEFIKDAVVTPAIFDIHMPSTYDQSDKERKIVNGARGEIFVYEYLKNLGYEPSCPQISTVNDYDRIISVKGKDYYYKTSFQNHDMVIEKDGVTIYLEVKSSRYRKTLTENMPISYREISMIDRCDNDNSMQSIIVRVYEVETDSPDMYFLNGTTRLKIYR